ncbi:hypothetical protein U1Q18_037844, partial [Sarracenia purpurea var. burkii]
VVIASATNLGDFGEGRTEHVACERASDEGTCGGKFGIKDKPGPAVSDTHFSQFEETKTKGGGASSQRNVSKAKGDLDFVLTGSVENPSTEISNPVPTLQVAGEAPEVSFTEEDIGSSEVNVLELNLKLTKKKVDEDAVAVTASKGPGVDKISLSSKGDVGASVNGGEKVSQIDMGTGGSGDDGESESDETGSASDEGDFDPELESARDYVAKQGTNECSGEIKDNEQGNADSLQPQIQVCSGVEFSCPNGDSVTANNVDLEPNNIVEVKLNQAVVRELDHARQLLDELPHPANDQGMGECKFVVQSVFSGTVCAIGIEGNDDYLGVRNMNGCSVNKLGESEVINASAPRVFDGNPQLDPEANMNGMETSQVQKTKTKGGGASSQRNVSKAKGDLDFVLTGSVENPSTEISNPDPTLQVAGEAPEVSFTEEDIGSSEVNVLELNLKLTKKKVDEDAVAVTASKGPGVDKISLSSKADVEASVNGGEKVSQIDMGTGGSGDDGESESDETGSASDEGDFDPELESARDYVAKQGTNECLGEIKDNEQGNADSLQPQIQVCSGVEFSCPNGDSVTANNVDLEPNNIDEVKLNQAVVRELDHARQLLDELPHPANDQGMGECKFEVQSVSSGTVCAIGIEGNDDYLGVRNMNGCSVNKLGESEVINESAPRVFDGNPQLDPEAKMNGMETSQVQKVVVNSGAYQDAYNVFDGLPMLNPGVEVSAMSHSVGHHSWAHVVKGGNHGVGSTKLPPSRKLEFIAPKDPSFPRVIEIEACSCPTESQYGEGKEYENAKKPYRDPEICQ